MNDEISQPKASLTKQQAWSALIPLFTGIAFLFIALVVGQPIQGVAFWLTVISFIIYGFMSQKNKKLIEAQGGESLSARMKTLLVIEHLAGLEDYGLSGAKSVMIVPEGLAFNISRSVKKLVTWDKIQQIEAGSEEQLRSRVTLSRVLLTGVFALALKKEKKQKFYITIETVDGVGLWNINSPGKNNRVMQEKAISFAAKCNSKVKSQSVQKTSSNENQTILDQIEKLSELFTKGVLSQSEFEAKKSELLKRL